MNSRPRLPDRPSDCYYSSLCSFEFWVLSGHARRCQPQNSNLYSDEEIRSLLRASLRMPYRYERGKLRPWVYYCLFGLLSVSGLRLGEARNLELQDADLKAAVLTIRGAKFG